MGRSKQYQKPSNRIPICNVTPLQRKPVNNSNNTTNCDEPTTNNLNNNQNNDDQLWAYTPKWRQPCLICGIQLLLSERQEFCCNSRIRNLISPLPELPSALQDLYMNDRNFSHFSCQYNSLFSFMAIGYTGGVIHLPQPNAFVINSHAYHQIHSANTEDVVDLIKQELAEVNPFVQGLYQLYNTNYPQARLVIQQPVANIEIAACVIIHSTAIVQERCIQIWRVGEEKPDYINFLNEHYKALQYPLFFP
ncbi:25298_t:CDS:2 [Dentiscutata erythropus]|uniref:25298_t:CDS:1 n=1 Tax=Dentiscutata erythropus TaxID=1348616 RepID=A0A9N8VXQ7_9GLOM|nr:25298_t:CDS:2 [Dentiscutata erythropus]